MLATARTIYRRILFKEIKRDSNFQGAENCQYDLLYWKQSENALTPLKKKFQDYPNCSIVEVGQNNEESPGDLRRLAVTQSLLKDHKKIKQELTRDNKTVNVGYVVIETKQSIT